MENDTIQLYAVRAIDIGGILGEDFLVNYAIPDIATVTRAVAGASVPLCVAEGTWNDGTVVSQPENPDYAPVISADQATCLKLCKYITQEVPISEYDTYVYNKLIEVRDLLKEAIDNTQKRIKQINNLLNYKMPNAK